MEFTPNTIVAGRYRILCRLGHGGMSTVYLARDEHFPHVERRCAVKVMRASDDPTLAELQKAAFEREASLLASLRHPAIPEVYDFFIEDGRCCLILEYIEGEDLERYLERAGKPLPESVLVDWALQVLDVLQFLHTQRPHPIVFRDLKPSNIMLRQDGSIVLIDFGIARLFQPQARGTTIGTEGYAPPEQYRGIADPRGDLYALGATLYHLATGIDPRQQPPFSLTQRPPRSMNPHLSEGFERIVLRALAYDPADRFPTAAAMAQALRALRIDSRPSPEAAPTVVIAPRTIPAANERIRILWTVRTGDEIRGSPLCTDDLVIFGSYDGCFYAVDRVQGLVRWRSATGRGIATTPIRYHDTVIGGSDDGAVYSLETTDGSVRWRYRTAGPIRSSPASVGNVIVFGSDDGFLYALDAATGAALWRRQARGPVRAAPHPAGEVIVSAADDAQLTVRTIRDGQPVWRQQLDAPIWARPVVFAGTVIVATIGGTVTCFALSDGSTRWRQTLPDAFVASPVVVGNVVLFTGNAGTVIACHPDSGAVLWQVSLRQRIASTPVPHGATVLVATGGGELVWLTLTGEIVERESLGIGIVSTPVMMDDILYLGALDGRFYALVIEWQLPKGDGQ